MTGLGLYLQVHMPFEYAGGENEATVNTYSMRIESLNKAEFGIQKNTINIDLLSYR